MVCQVKCDCAHPICSECSKRNISCEYQKKEVSGKTAPQVARNSQVDVEPERTPVLPNDAGAMPSYSCQFSEDPLSILTDTDDVGKPKD